MSSAAGSCMSIPHPAQYSISTHSLLRAQKTQQGFFGITIDQRHSVFLRAFSRCRNPFYLHFRAAPAKDPDRGRCRNKLPVQREYPLFLYPDYAPENCRSASEHLSGSPDWRPFVTAAAACGIVSDSRRPAPEIFILRERLTFERIADCFTIYC